MARSSPITYYLFPITSRRRNAAGMTLIELGVVMGIISILLALVLGLSRHVNEVIKFRRAQTDLGEWHEVLNTWYLKYGMYPDPVSHSGLRQIESNLVWLASTDIGTQYALSLSSGERVTFSSFASKPLKTSDPWGTPYFYQSTTNAYELLSCGPNAKHAYTSINGTVAFFPDDATTDTPAAANNADDVTFEP